MVAADMVRACYRALLRRERENETAARQKAGLTNLEALLTDFTEFAGKPERKSAELY